MAVTGTSQAGSASPRTAKPAAVLRAAAAPGDPPRDPAPRVAPGVEPGEWLVEPVRVEGASV